MWGADLNGARIDKGLYPLLQDDRSLGNFYTTFRLLRFRFLFFFGRFRGGLWLCITVGKDIPNALVVE